MRSGLQDNFRMLFKHLYYPPKDKFESGVYGNKENSKIRKLK
jgi:hypothetical protein